MTAPSRGGFKHTAGPWFRDGRTVYALDTHRNPDGSVAYRNGEEVKSNRFSAWIDFGRYANGSEFEGEANARLIAAAPELYEFVKRVADQKLCDEERHRCESQSGPYCGTHDWFLYDDDIMAARLLIAKAEGKQS